MFTQTDEATSAGTDETQKVKKNASPLLLRARHTFSGKRSPFHAIANAFIGAAASTLTPGDFTKLCFACVKSRRGDLLEALADPEFVGNERHLYGRLHLAAHQYITDRAPAEQAIIELVPKLEKLAAKKKKWIASWLRGVTSFTRDPLPPTPNLVLGATCNILNPVLNLPEDATFVYIGSCNQVYFEKYWKSLSSSWMEYDPGKTALFINVINPDEKLLDFLFQEASRVRSKRIYLTTSSGPNLPAYFASSRFFLARTALQRYGCPVYIIDVDGTFESPPTSTSPFPDHDVLVRDLKVGMPWGLLNASRVVVAPTQNGMLFLDVVTRYIATVFDPNKDQWFIDQNALEYGRLELLNKAPSNSFADLHLYPHLKNIVLTRIGSAKQTIVDEIKY